MTDEPSASDHRQRRAQIVKRQSEGALRVQIAEEFGCTPGYVQHLCARGRREAAASSRLAQVLQHDDDFLSLNLRTRNVLASLGLPLEDLLIAVERDPDALFVQLLRLPNGNRSTCEAIMTYLRQQRS
jgi:hypothetical protein